MAALLFFAGLMLRACVAHAAEPSPAFTKCINTHTTNLAWSQCSDQEISRQEQRLSQAWKTTFAAMKHHSPKAAALLLQEQHAWVRYKNAACQYYASGTFGEEGKALDYGACKAALITQRIDDLKDLAKDADQ
ncbi:MAG TPA: lysozyme inhibitor LprI family protein [Stellaceae bacterium]|nr:lysozyme inhibitor LprI family protein [Stellaceae bacterium]